MPQFKPPQKLGLLLSFAILLNRIALGLFLCLAGISKFQQGLSIYYAEHYTPLVPEWLNPQFAKCFGYSLPFAEVLFGGLLIIGFFTRTVSFFITLIFIAILIAITQQLGITALAENAGSPFSPDYILATLAFMLLVLGPGSASLDHILSKRKSKSAPAKDDVDDEDEFNFD